MMALDPLPYLLSKRRAKDSISLGLEIKVKQ